MQIKLRGLHRANRLYRPPQVLFLDSAAQEDWTLEVAQGGTAVVTADSACSLANLFYLLAGEILSDLGEVELAGIRTQGPEAPPHTAGGAPPRPQERGLGVLDARSALWWDRSLLDNVAAPLGRSPDAEARARAALGRCGVPEVLDPLRSKWRDKARRERRPEQRELLAAAAEDALLARPQLLPDFLAHKRVELARELAQGPRLLLVLDSCDCAGQPSLEGLYPLLAEVARDLAGLFLFSRTRRDDWSFAQRVYYLREGEGRLALEERQPADFRGPDPPPPLPDQDLVLRLEGMTKQFGSVTVIEDVTLDVERGKVTVWMGGSGCGKSTLLRMVAGILKPTRGRVFFNQRVDGRPTGIRLIVDPRTSPKVETRKAFGVLFQDGALFNSMTVAQNVAAPIVEHTDLHENVIDNMVKIKLDLVHMLGSDFDHPEHAHKFPSELSGGQKKRVGLARALALDPQVIFYDEPSAGLDPIVSREVDNLITKLGEFVDVTSIVITHELDSAFSIADKMVVLRKANVQENEYWGPARMIAQGTRAEIRGCVQPHVVEFLGPESYHYLQPLGWAHKNWYGDLFQETPAAPPVRDWLAALQAGAEDPAGG